MKKWQYPTPKFRSRTLRALVTLFCIGVFLYSALQDRQAREHISGAFADANRYFAVHFVDVGQGDAALVRAPGGECMLIDCGPTDEGTYLVKYLEQVGIEKLDYLVLTHPHEDHYGGAERILEAFPVENLVIHEELADTYPYDRLSYMVTHSAFDTSAKVVTVRRDDRLELTENAIFQFFAPDEIDLDDLNECSLALKLVYGKTSFLFTGDAEKGSERAMLSAGYNLHADVFSAGHHGSSTSNTPEFVQAVSPRFAVVSCGRDNSYGHPHKKTLETFEACGVEVHRTDEEGDVVFLSDGETVCYFDITPTGSEALAA